MIAITCIYLIQLKSYKEICNTTNHSVLSNGRWTSDQSTVGRSLIYSTETTAIDALDTGTEP